MLGGGFGHLGRGETGDLESVRRDLKVRQLGKAQQIPPAQAIELGPGRTVREGPGVEWLDTQRRLPTRHGDVKYDH